MDCGNSSKLYIVCVVVKKWTGSIPSLISQVFSNLFHFTYLQVFFCIDIGKETAISLKSDSIIDLLLSCNYPFSCFVIHTTYLFNQF